MEKEELVDLVRQNVVLKDRIDGLTSMQTEVKSKLRDGVKELGQEDDKGHLVVELDDDSLGVTQVVHQRRVSKTLDIEIAKSILDSKGLSDRCITMVPVLDENEIMLAYQDGLITEEDIDTMFPAKVTWALVMK